LVRNDRLFYGITASSKHTHVSRLSIATKEFKDMEIESEIIKEKKVKNEKIISYLK